MRLTVKFFGPQAVQVGVREQVIELAADPATVAELRRALAVAQPELAATLPTSRFAVNREFVEDSDIVCAGDEVALLGMMSGG